MAVVSRSDYASVVRPAGFSQEELGQKVNSVLADGLSPIFAEVEEAERAHEILVETFNRLCIRLTPLLLNGELENCSVNKEAYPEAARSILGERIRSQRKRNESLVRRLQNLLEALEV